jgi:3-phenylpropionate/trans-cinnamate dioxygenase ferredoxin subunit
VGLVRVVAAKAKELPAGERVIVDIDGRSVGLFNIDGRFYAIRNLCPHHGAPLCRGRVVGAIVPSDPTEYVYRPDKKVLRCPWHGFEFDIETGLSVCDPSNLRVKVYDTRVEDGDVVVYV